MLIAWQLRFCGSATQASGLHLSHRWQLSQRVV